MHHSICTGYPPILSVCKHFSELHSSKSDAYYASPPRISCNIYKYHKLSGNMHGTSIDFKSSSLVRLFFFTFTAEFDWTFQQKAHQNLVQYIMHRFGGWGVATPPTNMLCLVGQYNSKAILLTVHSSHRHHTK